MSVRLCKNVPYEIWESLTEEQRNACFDADAPTVVVQSQPAEKIKESPSGLWLLVSLVLALLLGNISICLYTGVSLFCWWMGWKGP